MLSKEQIEALLKIDTKSKKDSRALGIMSCDTPIKEYFVFKLNEIKQEYGYYPKSFTEQLALCILKFDSEVSKYLNDAPNSVELKAPSHLLTKQLIKNAESEMTEFMMLLCKVLFDGDYSSDTLHKILNYRIDSYIVILQLCGLVDISQDVFRSNFLSRVYNIKEEVNNYKNERMSKNDLNIEFAHHIDYLKEQLDIINDNDLNNEDFLVYIVMFDIKHYKPNSKHGLVHQMKR